MLVADKYIAVEPIQNVEVAKRQIRGGLSVIEQKIALVPLKVLFCTRGDFLIDPGATVWIEGGNLTNKSLNQKIYTVNGIDFMLIPKELIIMIDPIDKNPERSLEDFKKDFDLV